MTVATDPLRPSADDPNSIFDVGNPDICGQNVALNDPPPPYPSRERRLRSPRSNRRILVQRIQTSHHQQLSSDSQYEPTTPISPDLHEDEGFVEPTERTLLLGPALSRRVGGRPRSYSHASTTSVAPSLAQNVFSLFQTEDELDLTDGPSQEERSYLSPREDHGSGTDVDSSRSTGFFSTCRRYFRPLGRKVYYSSLLHLMVINFPYALLAWVYLFVFTVTGTTLLVALPLGAVLCFFNLLGARAFSRGELALQYRFHKPLSHPAPYPPRPIFTRYREPTEPEIESGRASSRQLVRETSFYKNTYAMFTDSTSYQALFYFLVIKPAITLILTILIWAFAFPLLLLVLPAPAVLRAVRRLGKWQANVAIEGLYLAVR